MGTHHTGIPLTRRNIQPPPIPIVRMVINEVVPNYANDTKVFYVTITGSNGYYATYVPISVSQPIILNNLQYGTYYISQNAEGGYTQISVTPSTFTLSADNPQQTVTITTVKNVGQVTVTKTITGVTEDETYFDITVTGIDNEYVEQFGQVRLDEPLVFYDLPFGSYVITEAETEGYTLDSITPSEVVLDVNTLTADVEIVNSVPAINALELTFRTVGDVIQWPVSDETQVSEWNTWLNLPVNGTPFTDVAINGNTASLSGGDLTSAAISSPDVIGIDGLTNFAQLVSVSIGDCQNLAITPDISGLSLLGAFLCFNCTLITDMPDITEFTGLTVMDLSNSGITSIVIPAGLTQLQSISMNGCFNLDTSDVDGVLAHFGTYRPAIQYVWLESLPYTPALLDAARAANPQAYFFT